MRSVIGVVGCGLMGAGIAEVCARAGYEVVVCESSPAALAAGRQRIESSLVRAVAAGKLAQDDADAARDRIRDAGALAELAGADLVIESIVEDEGAKRALLAELASIVGPTTILGTNTSSIPIMRLASATPCPERVIGIHFSNPVPVMPILEVVPSLRTSDQTIAAVVELAGVLGKRVVRSADRAGFVINALLIPYLLSAVRMLDAGVATAEDIDAAMVGAAGHPMGPLTVLDLIGLDTALHVASVLHAEHADAAFAPPPLLRRLVEAGSLGRKTGRGFHRYD